MPSDGWFAQAEGKPCKGFGQVVHFYDENRHEGC